MTAPTPNTTRSIAEEVATGIRLSSIRSHERYADIVERVLSRRLAELDGWVSVKDRLPKRGKMVLAYNEDWHYPIAAEIDSGGLWFVYHPTNHKTDQDITHWRELPQPPKD